MDYVIGPPSTYDTAYFEIKSIKTYNDPSFPEAIFNPPPANITQAPPPIFTAQPFDGAISLRGNFDIGWSLILTSGLFVVLALGSMWVFRGTQDMES